MIIVELDLFCWIPVWSPALEKSIAGPRYQRLRLITTTGRRERYGQAAFLGEDVPELLGVPGISQIERIALREGDLDRQILRVQ